MPDFSWKPRLPGLPSASRESARGSHAERDEDAGEAGSSPATSAEGRNARLRRSVGNQALQRLHHPEEGRESSDRSQSEPESRQRTTAEAALASLGPGRPLDAGLGRRLAGPGVDLASVRLHDDATAARLTAEHGARALTVGDHVAFAPGQLQPGTLTGDTLLAHELAHVEQQRRGAGRAGDASETALEADADRSAAGQLLARITGAGRRMGAALTTGLRLQGCFLLDGLESKKTPEEEFVANNTAWTGDLDSGQTDRIRAALDKVAGDNPALQNAFYHYFSSKEVNLMSGQDLKKAKAASRYAETSGGSDMKVDPDILKEGFNSATLGTLMLHELVHTRHPASNPLGMYDHLEGEAYAVEYHLAKRAGAEKRLKEIQEIMGKHMYGQDAYTSAWRQHFRHTYGTIDLLQRQADGEELPEVVPEAIRKLSKDQAQAHIAELLVSKEEDRSAELKALMEWVEGNKDNLKMPL